MPSSPPVFDAATLAAKLNGTLDGPGDVRIHGISTLDGATARDITFANTKRHLAKWPTSKAGALVVSQQMQLPANADGAAPPRPVIRVQDTDLAVITLLECFTPPEPAIAPGIHATAVVHPGATIGKGVSIGPHVTVEAGCTIADHCILHAGVRLYHNVTIGPACVLHANVVIRHNCRIGARVIIHQGAAIGADGFGYRPSPDGRGLLKVPHAGTVIIEDDVEIGANTCVDRAKFGATLIGAGTKIDNLCQIAHNVRIGRCCVIAGLTGIAGSVKIGNGVQIGGAAGIADHLTIGDGARIGGHSGVFGDIPAGESWVWYPAGPATDVLRQWRELRKLAQHPTRTRRAPRGGDLRPR